MDAREQEIIKRIFSVLGPLDDYRNRLEGLKRPPRGSRAAQTSKRVFGNLGTTFALSALSSATDHLLAWSLIVHGRLIPVSGHWAVIRGAMEGAVIVRWLLDPDQPYEERIRRSALMQLEDWRQRDRFERSLRGDGEHPPGPGKSGADRVEETFARMKRVGIIPEEKLLKDVQTESMTNMMRTYGHETMWRMASAFAHSSPWSGMLTRKDAEVEGQAVTGSKRIRVSANMEYALAGTSVSMKLIRAALTDLESHYGSKVVT